MSRTYWICAEPQAKTLHVFWLEGLRPVQTTPRHVMSYHGPFSSYIAAMRAVVTYQRAGYTFRPRANAEEDDSAESAIAAADARAENPPRFERGERYAH